jgi:hypothetical protein
MRIQVSAAAQAFPANLTNADVGSAGVFCILPSTRRALLANHSALPLVAVRQYFLKRDTVFFDALVYSERSALRFPNARSD